MKEYKSVIIALIASISAIVCISILSVSFVSYKKTANSGGIVATGSASCDFESDLVVWRGDFSVYGATPKDAYGTIKKDAGLIQAYLEKSGVTAEEMVFSSITIQPHYEDDYNEEGIIIGSHQEGYDLYQSVTVTSGDLDKVDTVSRDITTLIESGVAFNSYSPEYYYTKMDELKLQLIEEATANAKTRIDIMAVGTGGSAKQLLDASLGVFQITAQNSSSEDYSYGGVFNTSSRMKTASITVRLKYAAN